MGIEFENMTNWIIEAFKIKVGEVEIFVNGEGRFTSIENAHPVNNNQLENFDHPEVLKNDEPR